MKRGRSNPLISMVLINLFKTTATLEQRRHLARLDESEKLNYMRQIVELSDLEIFPVEIITKIFGYFTTKELQMICNENSFFARICKYFDLIGREYRKGRLIFSENRYVQLPRLYRRALSVACGDDFTVVLMDDGLAYACGENTRGQLGRETDGQYDWALRPIPNAEDITAVACGSQHTLLLNRTGSIFTCGFGYNGSLGDRIGDMHSRFNLTRIVYPPMVKIFAVLNHNLLLDVDGRVHVFGDNLHSQLGFGTLNRILMPRHLNGFAEPIISFSSGMECSLFVGRSGTLYGCGLDTHGMMGVGRGRYFSPFMIPNVPLVSSVSCGNFHTIIMTQNGGLLAAGKGFEGQLANGEFPIERRTFEPMLGLPINSIAISTIYTRRNASYVILSDGRIFRCGNRYSTLTEMYGFSVVEVAQAENYRVSIYYAPNQ
jgi:Regulator of chromosome condensation (RCC1) repeat